MDRLSEAASAIAVAEGPRMELPFDLGKGAPGPAVLLSARLARSTLGPDVMRLLAGSSDERSWAARIAWEQAEQTHGAPVGILLVLVNDEDPSVRATAAGGLISLMIRGSDDRAVIAAVERAVDDGGLLVPRAIARQLVDADELPGHAQGVLDRLREHPLTPVRRAARSADPTK